MAKRPNYLIEFKLHRSVAQELLDIYGYQISSFEGGTELDELLRQHLKDMYVRLDRIIYLMDKSSRLSLNNSEALAFYMFWSTTDTSGWPLANALISDMVLKIDKRTKAPVYAK